MELRTKYHIINSGDYGYRFKDGEMIDKNKLVIIHNSGFFSCCSIALEDIMIYFNTHKGLPEEVDRSQQFMYYKNLPYDNLIPVLFGETDAEIPFVEPVEITDDKVWFQWSNYRLINFAGLKPFIDKYFAPSQLVLDRVTQLERDYQIDYENTVGVLYRGNDKVKECGIAGYEAFIEKMSTIEFDYEGAINFLISPDETEFKNRCEYEFHEERCISPSQWLHMPKDSNTAIFMHLPQNERPEHAINVLASIIMLSKCKHLITHTGNMSFWCCLYRGNMNNVHQIREGQWL